MTDAQDDRGVRRDQAANGDEYAARQHHPNIPTPPPAR
jgi:hypothetical protein